MGVELRGFVSVKNEEVKAILANQIKEQALLIREANTKTF